MATSLARFKVVLGLNSERFRTGMQAAAESMTRFQRRTQGVRRVASRAFLGITAAAAAVGLTARVLQKDWEQIAGKPQSAIRESERQFNRLSSTIKAGLTQLALPAVQAFNKWIGRAADTLQKKLDPATAKMQRQFEALRRLRLERELATQIPIEGITLQPGGGLGPRDLMFQARLTRANVETVANALMRDRETPSEGVTAEPSGGIF